MSPDTSTTLHTYLNRCLSRCQFSCLICSITSQRLRASRLRENPDTRVRFPARCLWLAPQSRMFKRRYYYTRASVSFTLASKAEKEKRRKRRRSRLLSAEFVWYLPGGQRRELQTSLPRYRVAGGRPRASARREKSKQRILKMRPLHAPPASGIKKRSNHTTDKPRSSLGHVKISCMRRRGEKCGSREQHGRKYRRAVASDRQKASESTICTCSVHTCEEPADNLHRGNKDKIPERYIANKADKWNYIKAKISKICKESSSLRQEQWRAEKMETARRHRQDRVRKLRLKLIRLHVCLLRQYKLRNFLVQRVLEVLSTRLVQVLQVNQHYTEYI